MYAFIDYLVSWEDPLWNFGALIVILSGIFYSFKSKFMQVRRFPKVLRNFLCFFRFGADDQYGVHPLKVFFTSIGGAIGVGNIVAVCTAVKIGGPGAVFWVWLAGIFGMLIKYSEVFLGVKYRKKNIDGSYDGGPMYFLPAAFNGKKWSAILVSVLLCVYGTEIYMFRVMTDSISLNWEINRYLVMTVLLLLIIFAGRGGVRRVGDICSVIVPIFLVLFSVMSLYVLVMNAGKIPEVLRLIFSSAFTGHAASGAFVGSSILMTISQGVARGCYSGDIGVGYASIVHSESSVKDPKTQASLGIFGIFLDTFVICTLSLMLILVTDIWRQDIETSLLVQYALEAYFPMMHFFMPFFLFLLGYSTMIAFFCVGLKCAQFLSPKWGTKVYYIYAVSALIFFSFVSSDKALIIMGMCGALLLIINSVGIFKLRREVDFDF